MSASSSTPAKAEETRGGQPRAPAAGQRRFNRAELSSFDGTVPGRPVLIEYRGRVYDVSDGATWAHGRHFWLRAGRDLTGQLDVAPHGEEVLDRLPWVGLLAAEHDS